MRRRAQDVPGDRRAGSGAQTVMAFVRAAGRLLSAAAFTPPAVCAAVARCSEFAVFPAGQFFARSHHDERTTQ